jgi:Mg2+ and Co2+ transporter CorA
VPQDRELISCRNQADSIERAADLVYEDAEHGLQYAIAKQGEYQAAATHRLNVMAALFLPLATIAAVFGMNLPHGFEQVDNPMPFMLVLFAGMSMGIVVKAFIVPRPRHGRRDRYAIKPLGKRSRLG